MLCTNRGGAFTPVVNFAEIPTTERLQQNETPENLRPYIWISWTGKDNLGEWFYQDRSGNERDLTKPLACPLKAGKSFDYYGSACFKLAAIYREADKAKSVSPEEICKKFGLKYYIVGNDNRTHKRIIYLFIRYPKNELAENWRLGIEVGTITAEDRLSTNRLDVGYSQRTGVQILDVFPSLPASKATINLDINDIITKINGKQIYDYYDFYEAEHKLPLGKPCTITFIRRGIEQTTEVITYSPDLELYKW